jgi:fucose permease
MLNINCYLSMLAMGSFVGAIGPLLVYIVRFYHLEVSMAGVPVVADAAGYFAGTFMVSFVWRLSWARFILLCSAAAMGVSLLGIVFVHGSYPLFLLFLFLLGLSSGFLNVGVDSLFSEIYGVNRARYLALSHLFFGIGAFIGPLLVVFSLWATGIWYLYFLFMGLIFVPIALIFWNRRVFESVTETAAKNSASVGTVCTGFRELALSPVFWGFVMVMFFNLGVEIAFSSWTPLYFAEIRQSNEAFGGYLISTFWFALILGRFVLYRVAHRIDLTLFLIWGSLGSALFIFLIYYCSGAFSVLLFTALFGLVFSAMYPSILAVATGLFPGQVGRVTGAISTGGAVGCIFFPWIMGPVTRAAGLSRSVYFIPVICMVMGGIVALVFLFQKRNGRVTAGC